MLHPVLTLLVASSLQMGADSASRADLAEIVLSITDALPSPATAASQAEAVLTVCDIPFYYSDFTPVPAPAAPILVTYDWRSPVIFDLP